MKPIIRFVDLARQYRSIQADIDKAVARVLASSAYVLGPEVEQFEKEFAAYHGVDHAVAVNSGTSALHLALLAAGIGPGDEVVTVSLTFVATVAAIAYTGATPVFAEVDAGTLTMDPSSLGACISPRTRAVVPVHLYGQPADMDAINEIARRYDLQVIEDAAQAHGARYRGRRVGGLGHSAAFSFYPAKNLGAFGEGGMLTTNEGSSAQRARMLRNWGQRRKGVHELPGYNYRMDELQAAVLRVKLKRLDEWTEIRREHARYYRSELTGTDLKLPREQTDREHVYHLFSVFTPQRDDLARTLAEHGIETGIHYPVPVHLQPAFCQLGYGVGDLPLTESAALEQLSIPLYPELEADEIQRVVAAVRGWSPGPPP